ncbi:RHS repeat domain-containing protein, partial [Aeromicrobium sp. CF4.19]|uniref:RHS repeat domain-containing protein n=1 Tax=Aeromicrobium sp. CF4.19 TaxID=3373082 RepID=UPI003EE46448
ATAGMYEFPSQEVTTARPCGTAPTAESHIVSASRTAYDGAGFGATPTKGNPTRVDGAKDWSGSIDYQREATTTYDAYGRPTAVTDAADQTTTTAYSPSSGPVETVTTTNPLDQATVTHPTRSWGTPTRETDVAGAHTDTSHDALGRIVSVWGPDRTKGTDTPHAKFAYDVSKTKANTVTTERLNPAGDYVKSVAFYDGLMRERGTQSPSANDAGGRVITETRYDDRGWVSAKMGPYYTTGSVNTTLVSAEENQVDSYTLYGYDRAGRVTRESLASLGAVKWSTLTSHEGDRTRVTPPEGGTPTVTVQDVRGRTTKLHQFQGSTPSGANDVTTYTHTPAGDLASVTDSSGTQWTKSYDLRGRLISEVDPDKGTTSHTYDAMDRRVSSTDARGLSLWTGHDALGRKTELRDDDADGDLRAEWTYDTVREGSLTSSTRHANGEEYTNETTNYDAAGRPLDSRFLIPQSEGLHYWAGGHTSGFAYNPDGSVRLARQPLVFGISNENIQYTYDDLGNVDSMRGVGYFASDTYRRSTGEVLQRTLGTVQGKLAYAASTYDASTRRLTGQSFSLQGSATTNRMDLRYSYDQEGNITKLDDVAAADTRRECFDYDYLRRLEKAWTTTTTDCAAPSDATLGSQAPYADTYAYAKNGNRTEVVSKRKPGASITNSTETTSYPSPTALQPHAATQTVKTGHDAETEDFSYDMTGNLLQRSTAADEGTAYEWDREGRVSKVTDLDTDETITYLYDADGNRLIERNSADDSEILYMGTAEITVKDGARSTVRTYTLDGVPVATRDSNGLHMSAVNHQNTPVLTANSATQDWTKRRYSPFGEQLQNPSTPWPTARGFLNKQTDTDIGTVHLDAREYDPTDGRFISVDPIADFADPQQLNGYAYANNTPVTMMDPDGLRPSCGGGCGGDYNSPVAYKHNYNGTARKGAKPGNKAYNPKPYVQAQRRAWTTRHSWLPKQPSYFRSRVNGAAGALSSLAWLADAVISNPRVPPSMRPNQTPSHMLNGWFDRVGVDRKAPEYLTGNLAGHLGQLLIPGGQTASAAKGSNLLARALGRIRNGSSSSVQSLEGVLGPVGQRVGKAGSNDAIREIPGGLPEARAMFSQLSEGGSVVAQTSKLTRVELPRGGTVQLRTAMSKKSPRTAATIDVNVSGVDDLRKLKFNP